MGVVFFKGVAAGPVIASGITYCILQIIKMFHS
jgi:putative membrane protein